jgi:hypothetical protein
MIGESRFAIDLRRRVFETLSGRLSDEKNPMGFNILIMPVKPFFPFLLRPAEEGKRKNWNAGARPNRL